MVRFILIILKQLIIKAQENNKIIPLFTKPQKTDLKSELKGTFGWCLCLYAPPWLPDKGLIHIKTFSQT